MGPGSQGYLLAQDPHSALSTQGPASRGRSQLTAGAAPLRVYFTGNFQETMARTWSTDSSPLKSELLQASNWDPRKTAGVWVLPLKATKNLVLGTCWPPKCQLLKLVKIKEKKKKKKKHVLLAQGTPAVLGVKEYRLTSLPCPNSCAQSMTGDCASPGKAPPVSACPALL